MRYYSDSRLGLTRAKTPEGFLICADVPIARTGIQKYDSWDVSSVEPNDDGTIDMERTEGEVFAPAAIASFEGKPVTNDHPDGEFVTPGNWHDYVIGHVQNVRRGDDRNHDLLLADLFIYDPRGIADIESGKIEVSCGYDHEVEILGRGRGRQTEIVGNHVALVDLGRCGPRCAIGDREMPVKPKMKISDLLRRAFRAKTADELKTIEADAGEAGIITDPDCADDESPQGGEHQVHIHLAPAIASDKKDDEEKDDKSMDSSAKAVDARLTKLETGVGRILTALDRISPPARGRRDKRKDDIDPEMAEDDDDPEMDSSEREEDAEEEETEEEKRKREKREREDDSRGRDEFGEAPGKMTGKKILGEMEFRDPLGDARSPRATRRDFRREAGSRDSRAADSAGLRDGFAALLADAEIILPGVRLPTFDARAARSMTLDRMCAFRRRTLVAAMDDDGSREMIVDANGGDKPNFRSASCDSVKAIFGATASIARSRGEIQAPGRVGRGKDARSMVAKMEEANRKFYDKSTPVA